MAFKTKQEAVADIVRRANEQNAKAPDTYAGYVPPDPAHLARDKQQLHERWNEHERERNARRPLSYRSDGTPVWPKPAE